MHDMELGQKVFLGLTVIAGACIVWRWWRAMPARRVASISAESRELFQRWGAEAVRLVLVSGHHPAASELSNLYGDPELKRHALEWLSEIGIEEARHTVRIEIVEWAILWFVFVSVFVEVFYKTPGY
jgi:hypothetical protein